MAQDDLQAARLREEGVSRYQEGDLKGAVERLEESARLFAEDGRVKGQAEALGDLGAVLMKGSQPGRARECLTESLALFVEAKDDRGRAHVLGNLGALDASGGDLSSAEDNLLQAAKLFGELEEELLCEDTWRAVTRLRLRQGRWLESLLAYQQGLDCLRRPSLGKRFLRWFLRLPLYVMMR
jgi:tetratricopeptide (TPR) repeat protein